MCEIFSFLTAPRQRLSESVTERPVPPWPLSGADPMRVHSRAARNRAADVGNIHFSWRGNKAGPLLGSISFFLSFCAYVCVDSLMGFLNILVKNNYSGKIWQN